MGTSEGQEGLQFVRSKLPRVARGPEHEMVYDAGRIEGFNQCLDAIIGIIGIKEVKEQQMENNPELLK